jgi:hypothetical protein
MTVSSRTLGGRGRRQLDDELIRSSDLSQTTARPRRLGDDFGVLGVGLASIGVRNRGVATLPEVPDQPRSTVFDVQRTRSLNNHHLRGAR